jgi:tetratricopeptide (TPR) repeat protein
MNAKLRIAGLALFLAMAGSIAGSAVFAQAAPPRAPLDRAEIMGRLALGYPPSYVAELVAQRGLRFSLTADFLYRVKLAGGDGILVEKLSAADASSSSAAVNDDNGASVDHLAKCAELIRTGDDESAKPECQSAISENPKSPWPLLVVANSMKVDSFSNDPSEAERKKKAEFQGLMQRAALLDPTLPAVRFLAQPFQTWPAESADSAKALMEDNEQFQDGNQEEWRNGPGLSNIVQVASGVAEPTTAETDDDPIPPEMFQRAQEKPELSSNHTTLATQYEMRRAFAKAEVEWREVLRLEPNSPVAHTQLGKILLAEHKPEPAIAEFREAVRVVPFGDYEHMILAGALESLGRTRDAVGELQSTIALRPADTELSEALVRLSVDHHDLQAAIEELRRSLEVSVESAATEADAVRDRSSDEENLANLLREDKQFAAAGEQYLYLLRFNPDSWGLHNDYANVLLGQRSYDAAIAEYYEALRLNPNSSMTHDNIGFVLMMKKDEEAAIAEFRNTLDLSPEDPGAENNLAWIYCTAEDRKLRNPAEALALARRAVAATTDWPNPAFLDTLAEAQFLNGQQREALASESQALALEPDNADYKSRVEKFRSASTAVASAKP